MGILIFFLPFFLLMAYFNGNNQNNDSRLEHAIHSFIQQDTVRLYFPLKEKGQDSLSNANALDTLKNI